MLKKFALQYYKEDVLPKGLVDYINECYKKVERKLNRKTNDLLKLNHYFHDAYVTKVDIFSEQEETLCRINLLYNRINYILVFRKLSFIQVVGELVSSEACYPGAKVIPSFAQVLDIWIDYKKEFECYILLDSERFVILKSSNIQFE